MNTQKYVPTPSNARLVVLEKGNLRFYQLAQRQQWTVGRISKNNTPDVAFQTRIVSRQHGWLMGMDEEWYYVDNPQNTNGTFLNGIPIERPLSGTRKPITLKDGDILRICARMEDGRTESVVMLYTTCPVSNQWALYPLEGQDVLFGREPGCHVIWQDPAVSGKHAVLSCRDGVYYLWDFGSRAGTMFNGRMICSTVALGMDDHFSICGKNCFFLGDRLLYEK